MAIVLTFAFLSLCVLFKVALNINTFIFVSVKRNIQLLDEKKDLLVLV